MNPREVFRLRHFFFSFLFLLLYVISCNVRNNGRCTSLDNRIKSNQLTRSDSWISPIYRRKVRRMVVITHQAHKNIHIFETLKSNCLPKKGIHNTFRDPHFNMAQDPIQNVAIIGVSPSNPSSPIQILKEIPGYRPNRSLPYQRATQDGEAYHYRHYTL